MEYKRGDHEVLPRSEWEILMLPSFQIIEIGSLVMPQRVYIKTPALIWLPYSSLTLKIPKHPCIRKSKPQQQQISSTRKWHDNLVTLGYHLSTRALEVGLAFPVLSRSRMLSVGEPPKLFVSIMFFEILFDRSSISLDRILQRASDVAITLRLRNPWLAWVNRLHGIVSSTRLSIDMVRGFLSAFSETDIIELATVPF